MFTGIVEEIGIVQNIQRGVHSASLFISAKTIMDDLKIGDSVAVNGVCLTATTRTDTGFTADIMHESLNRSSLSELKRGSRVNLERAMLLNGRFGGHIVSGHIDGVGKILSIEKDDNAIWYQISAAKEIMRYIVEKGSITIDGISLTVAELSDTSFKVSIIPHTASVTILGEKKVGQVVNLENDVLGKYVEKLLSLSADTKEEKKESKLTMAFLRENGF